MKEARESPAWKEGDEVIIMAVLAHVSQQWAIEANQCKQEITMLLAQYQWHTWLFLKEAAKHFPPLWPKDLAVWLKLGAPDTINCKVYPLACNELQAVDIFMNKNKELGGIKKANSPWGSPFFIKKKDGSFRPV